LVEALKPKYGFDRVICFEPSTKAIKKLRKFLDSRVEVYNAALSDKSGVSILYSAGTLGASVFSEKPLTSKTQEKVELIDAKVFFSDNFSPEDELYIKLNAEGSELEILRSLLRSEKTKWRIKSILISWDVHKIPSRKDAKLNLVTLLESREINYSSRKHEDPSTAMSMWFLEEDVIQNVPSILETILYFMKIPKWFIIRNIFRNLLPKKLWIFLALNFGPNKKRRL
jgi:FkbM family methyltransferase